MYPFFTVHPSYCQREDRNRVAMGLLAAGLPRQERAADIAGLGRGTLHPVRTFFVMYPVA